MCRKNSLTAKDAKKIRQGRKEFNYFAPLACSLGALCG